MVGTVCFLLTFRTTALKSYFTHFLLALHQASHLPFRNVFPSSRCNTALLLREIPAHVYVESRALGFKAESRRSVCHEECGFSSSPSSTTKSPRVRLGSPNDKRCCQQSQASQPTVKPIPTYKLPGKGARVAFNTRKGTSTRRLVARAKQGRRERNGGG